MTSTLTLNGHSIVSSTFAENVGVLRSVDDTMPHVLARISAHTRAVMAVLPSGMARGHNGNPAASLQLERLYGCPVLMSGMSTLVLSKPELSVLHQHFKQNLERLMKLHRNTPECVVMFLAGSLPATAILHLRMLTLLGMIARLGEKNILHQHARTVLLSHRHENKKSWFIGIRIIYTCHCES